VLAASQLSQRLGGAALVDVVLFRANLRSMAGFKMADRYTFNVSALVPLRFRRLNFHSTIGLNGTRYF
jgi:hypothetical protein